MEGQQCQQWWSAVEARARHKEVGGSEGDGEGSGGDGSVGDGGSDGGGIRASTSAILSMRHFHVWMCSNDRRMFAESPTFYFLLCLRTRSLFSLEAELLLHFYIIKVAKWSKSSGEKEGH